ncbi:MAG: formate dehydrogenase accessory protein FdhE [Syntrophomonadaceae bacterium]|nr:formate dehydrogenase accessory protein FdhE [Syntrophomonadaceae bacterium]
MNIGNKVELPPGYLDFYGKLSEWQKGQQKALKAEYVPPIIRVRQVLHDTQKPILISTEFRADWSPYRQLFKDLLDFLQIARPEIKRSLEIIADRVTDSEIDSMAIKLMQAEREFFGSLAEQLGIADELIVFAADYALRPLLRLWAGPFNTTIAEMGQNAWVLANVCPFCGSQPHMSRINASDGRRFMFCDRCLSQWEARNLYCVHCGNDDPHSIQYLAVDNEPVFQIYTCGKCRSYLKSYDERMTGIKVDLGQVDIETIYLDLLAQEQGYANNIVAERTWT